MSNLVITEHYLRLEAPPELVKVIAVALDEYRGLNSIEFSTTMSDFIFNMETAYQTHYGLDQDDWGFTAEDLIELGFMEVSDE
jgi:hypothetical protein